MAVTMPARMASCPMYRWQNPPNFCMVYSCPHFSSKRRISSMSLNQRRWVSLPWPASPPPLGADFFFAVFVLMRVD